MMQTRVPIILNRVALMATLAMRRRDGQDGSPIMATKTALPATAGRPHAPRFCIIDLPRDGGSSPDRRLSAEERLRRYDLMINQCICRVTEKPTPGKVDAIIPEAETSRYRPESTSQTGLDPEKPLPGTTVQRQSQRHGSEWSRSRTNRLIFKLDIFTGGCLVAMLCRGSTAVLLRQGQANRLESVCKENIFLSGQLF